MRSLYITIVGLLFLGTAGCTITEKVDFSRYRDFLLLGGAPIEEHTVWGYFEVRGYGANIFGFIPVGVVSIEDAIAEMVDAAQKAGVDGISHLKVERLGPPFPWAFLLWYKGVKVSGFGFKLVKGKRI
ncbi:MAG: hypothetical protein N2234_04090 [Planctomycetota bacterium]|nr:hypothetical protein [Planctomycetota bacterium]